MRPKGIMPIMAVIGIGQCSWDYLAVVDDFPEPDTKGEVHGWTEQGGGSVGRL